MKITREIINTLIADKNWDFFRSYFYYEDGDLTSLLEEYDFNSESNDEEIEELKFKRLWSENFGDGNDMTYVYRIDFDDTDSMIIRCDGWYSSHDESVFTDVYEAVPYQFTETRYKNKN